MRIIFGERNVGRAANGSGEQSGFKIENLQPLLCEQEMAGDAFERQSFAEEHVVDAARCVDGDVDARVLAALELIDAVGRDVWRMTEFVWDDRFPKLWVNPKNRFRRTQGCFDVVDPNFVMFEIIGEASGADAFIPRHS